MIAAARSPKSSRPSAPKSAPPPARRAWTPNEDDHFIYHQVKFRGKSQQEAGSMRMVSQSAVSRMLQRYERWLAHAQPREGGQLDPAERGRAQRWLTYERNELIVTGALRIAQELEGKTDLWKTVRIEPTDPYQSRKGLVRDETKLIDRTGVVARFLRLAFQVNMAQLQLVQQDEPAMPAPLTEEELAEEERLDAAVAAEFAALQQSIEADRQATAQDIAAEAGDLRPAAGAGSGDPCTTGEQVCSRLEGEDALETVAAAEPATMHAMHNTHYTADQSSAATDAAACTCNADAACGKNADEACMGSPAGAPRSARQRRFTPEPTMEVQASCPDLSCSSRSRDDEERHNAQSPATALVCALE